MTTKKSNKPIQLFNIYEKLSVNEQLQFRQKLGLIEDQQKQQQEDNKVYQKIERIHDSIDGHVDKNRNKLNSCCDTCCFLPKSCLSGCTFCFRATISLIFIIMIFIIIGFFKKIISTALM